MAVFMETPKCPHHGSWFVKRLRSPRIPFPPRPKLHPQPIIRESAMTTKEKKKKSRLRSHMHNRRCMGNLTNRMFFSLPASSHILSCPPIPRHALFGSWEIAICPIFAPRHIWHFDDDTRLLCANSKIGGDRPLSYSAADTTQSRVIVLYLPCLPL